MDTRHGFGHGGAGRWLSATTAEGIVRIALFHGAGIGPVVARHREDYVAGLADGGAYGRLATLAFGPLLLAAGAQSGAESSDAICGESQAPAQERGAALVNLNLPRFVDKLISVSA